MSTITRCCGGSRQGRSKPSKPSTPNLPMLRARPKTGEQVRGRWPPTASSSKVTASSTEGGERLAMRWRDALVVAAPDVSERLTPQSKPACEPVVASRLVVAGAELAGRWRGNRRCRSSRVALKGNANG